LALWGGSRKKEEGLRILPRTGANNRGGCARGWEPKADVIFGKKKTLEKGELLGKRKMTIRKGLAVYETQPVGVRI